MKNSQRGFVPILLIIVAVVAIGGGAYVYQQNPGNVLKSLKATPQEKMRKEAEGAQKLFPATLGNYELYKRHATAIDIEQDCDKLEEHSDSKDWGLKGEICVKSMRGEYRERGGKKVVFVIFSEVLSGRDLMDAVFEKAIKPETLDGYVVYRAEGHEIGWRPIAKFDTIGTQEGEVNARPDGGESMNYRNDATGKNPVTQYFLNKYPPKKSN